MAWTRVELALHVDALAEAYEGEAFVGEVSRFAQESLDARERELLQEVLLERAAEEEDFRKAVRRRFAEKGWTRRMLDRVDRLARGDAASELADRVAAVVVDGDAEPHELEQAMEGLRTDRGKAALVLDELSRHPNAIVRRWVPSAAREVLGEGGARLILSMTRDRDPGVRDRSIEQVVRLDSAAARRVIPDLRRRLQSRQPYDAVFAMWKLAELGDRESLPRIRRIAEEAPSEEFRRISARAVRLALEGREAEARAALEDCVVAAPDERCRALCLERLGRPGSPAG
jgi:hypothetical protein